MFYLMVALGVWIVHGKAEELGAAEWSASLLKKYILATGFSLEEDVEEATLEKMRQTFTFAAASVTMLSKDAQAEYVTNAIGDVVKIATDVGEQRELHQPFLNNVGRMLKPMWHLQTLFDRSHGGEAGVVQDGSAGGMDDDDGKDSVLDEPAVGNGSAEAGDEGGQ